MNRESEDGFPDARPRQSRRVYQPTVRTSTRLRGGFRPYIP